jgi:hypothetical protein
MFASASTECCIYLQRFFSVFQTFLQVFQMLVLSVSFVFFCMLQLLHLDVLKVDRVLHMGCMSEAAGCADDFRSGTGPLLVCFLVSPTSYRSFAVSVRHRPDGHLNASKSVKTNIRNFVLSSNLDFYQTRELCMPLSFIDHRKKKNRLRPYLDAHVVGYHD